MSAARRAVAEMAFSGGAGDASRADRLAAELGAGLLLHPGGGFLLARALEPPGGLELIAVAHAGNGSSMKLRDELRLPTDPDSPAGARVVAFCDVWSYGRGTAVLARVGAGPSAPPACGLRAGGVSTAAVEGDLCGDAWAVVEAEGSLSVLVVDGLGHGAGAEPAAAAAVDAFLKEPMEHPETVLRRVHEAMLGTRGGVAAVCRIDPAGRRAIFAGVGNITGRYLVGERSQALVSASGSVGTHIALPQPRVETIPWGPGAAVVFATDGLRSNLDLDARPALLACDPAVSAAILLRDLHKGNDDATVVVVRDDSARTP